MIFSESNISGRNVSNFYSDPFICLIKLFRIFIFSRLKDLVLWFVIIYSFPRGFLLHDRPITRTSVRTPFQVAWQSGTRCTRKIPEADNNGGDGRWSPVHTRINRASRKFMSTDASDFYDDGRKFGQIIKVRNARKQHLLAFSRWTSSWGRRSRGNLLTFYCRRVDRSEPTEVDERSLLTDVL